MNQAALVTTSTSFIFEYPKKNPYPPLASPLKLSDLKSGNLPIGESRNENLVGVIGTRQVCVFVH